MPLVPYWLPLPPPPQAASHTGLKQQINVKMKTAWHHQGSTWKESFEYDVFLSFRGADIRTGFADNLYHSLKDRGLRVFMDDKELSKGQRLEKIFRAVDTSETFIPIFSRNYADSKWCLMEISRMVDCGRMIIPVFLDTDPSHVRNQTGPFEPAFSAYREMKGLSQILVDKWREVLREVGEISGYDLTSDADGNEYKLIQLIMKRLLCVVQTPFELAKYPVGLHSRVDDMMKLLHFETYDVRMVGIYGIAGVGKTTLAKAICNKISSRFEASCYLLNVREEAESNGIVSLQKKIICDILKDKHTVIEDVSQGIRLLKRRLKFKRVLLILDDVSDEIELDALVGNRDWFCERSRIIIATRCKDTLRRLDEDEIYEVNELNPDHSLQLFSYHAFAKERPPGQYMTLARKVVKMAGGLPLAMEVYGSLFFRKSLETWENMLKKLERTQHDKLFHRFKVSYDDLDENEKRIFLDIACFFVGKGKENAIHMWKGSDLLPDLSIDTLLNRSLVKINKKNEFEMHEQIQSMGKQIVLQEGISKPGMRSRLWDSNEIHDVLQYLDNIEAVVSIDMEKQKDLNTEAFAATTNLKMLHINYGNIKGEFQKFPKKLKWLNWKGFPLKTLPYDLNVEKLVVLELPLSNITQVCPQMVEWKDKIFRKLKVLDLFGCNNLKKTPDFAIMPSLEKIVLDRCISLTEVDKSIGCLGTLVFLSLRECEALENLPTEICKLTSLQVFILQGCDKLCYLPECIGEMNSLKELDLSMTAITELPSSLGNLSNLETLNCRFCKSLHFLTCSLGYASKLKRLYLPTCVKLPDSIKCLSNLQELEVSLCKKVNELPDSIKFLVIHSASITTLPENLGSLHKLQHLDLSGNLGLTQLPNCFFFRTSAHTTRLTRFSYLKILNLSGTSIDLLPKDFHHCVMVLEELHLTGTQISILSQLPPSLVILDASFCSALKAAYVSNLKHLKKLNFEGCKDLVHVKGLEEMKSLESLRMKGCFNLSYELWTILCEEATFKNLEKYSIEGKRTNRIDGRQAFSFVVPKGDKNGYNLYGCVMFPYWRSSSVHLSVEMEFRDRTVLKTSRTVHKLGNGFIVRFEVDDEICSLLKGIYRMIRVSMHDNLPEEGSINFHFCNKEHFPKIVDDVFMTEMRFDRLAWRDTLTDIGAEGDHLDREQTCSSLPAFQQTIASPSSKPVSAPLRLYDENRN